MVPTGGAITKQNAKMVRCPEPNNAVLQQGDFCTFQPPSQITERNENQNPEFKIVLRYQTTHQPTTEQNQKRKTLVDNCAVLL
jgi:hypothetical protein